MEADAKQFLIKFAFFSLAVIGTAAILFISVLKPYYVRTFPLQLIVISIFTIFTHLRLIKAVEKNIQVFTNTYILSITIKLLLYFMFLLVCLLIDSSNALAFVVSFFILYICYTVFEVIQLLNVKKRS
jgi:hypothetical protein